VRFREQLDALHASQGGAAWRRISRLQLTARIVGLNGEELFEGILDLSREPLFPRLWAAENEPTRREYHAELVRLLHNYLASIKTLVDHTRQVIREDYRGHAIAAEFKARLETDIANSALVGFVHDLRNFALHVGLPPTVLRLTISNSSATPESRLILRLSPLKRWNGWSKRGRAHLHSFAADPVVYDVLKEYDAVIRAFHEWLLHRLHVEHDVAIEEYLRSLQVLVPSATHPKPSP